MDVLGTITWRKGNGNELTTNDAKATVDYCVSLKWERLGEVAAPLPAHVVEDIVIPEHLQEAFEQTLAEADEIQEFLPESFDTEGSTPENSVAEPQPAES